MNLASGSGKIIITMITESIGVVIIITVIELDYYYYDYYYYFDDDGLNG